MQNGKAIVRSGVLCAAARGAAPCGEYDLIEEEGAVRLSSASLENEFTLSTDSFCRLIAEGRISILAS